ncbi:MAG: heme exporter protein CcmB [Alphaproteobacteria bacterium]|nr:heme exporter protein CcmB [Alphaproteobacteria bacterium]
MTGVLVLLRRELRLALRQWGDVAMVLSFFVITVVLFPFGIGPEPNILTRISPGIIWVTALLASMLSLDRLFLADYEDGSLDLLVAGPLPLMLVVLTKCAAHWLTTGLPLIAAAPLLAVLLNMDAAAFPVLIVAMALGMPTLTLLGAVGAALTLGARRGGVLLSLLLLPLYIPVLIFGVGAVDAALGELAVRPHLLFLGALFLFALVLAPWASAAALREAVA